MLCLVKMQCVMLYRPRIKLFFSDELQRVYPIYEQGTCVNLDYNLQAIDLRLGGCADMRSQD